MSAHLFVYDIPQRSGFANPSIFLRRFAFRLNLSCWVVKDSDVLPRLSRLIQRMQKAGVRWYTVKFDQQEGEKLVRMATDSLRNDIQAAVNRGVQASVRANLALARGNDTPNDKLKAHKARCVLIAKRLGRTFKDLKACADNFGVREELGIGEAVNQVQGIRTAMLQRATVYLKSLATAEQFLGSADPMVKAMKKGEVPLWVAADYLEERGEKKLTRQAERLRKVSMF